MKAAQRSGVDIRALLCNSWQAFVDIKVTAPKGCVATVDVSVFRYVVTLKICIATVNIMIYRFPEPAGHIIMMS
jgi:hypothetical protein